MWNCNLTKFFATVLNQSKEGASTPVNLTLHKIWSELAIFTITRAGIVYGVGLVNRYIEIRENLIGLLPKVF